MTTLDIIRDLCKENGYSLSGLEKKLGFGNASLSKVKSLPFDRIIQIADFFKKDINYFIPNRPTPTSIAPISDETEAELLENFRMLNVVGRRMLIDRSRELIQLGYKKGALDGLEDDAV